MITNRLRYILLFVCSALLLLFLISTFVYLIKRTKSKSNYPICPRPKQYLKDYDYDFTLNSREFQNVNQTIDYFRLSLSWSPTFCASKKQSEKYFQCQQSFGLIVHGLWPNTKNATNIRSHPRNCRNDQQIPLDIIDKYFCLMPSEILMQAEWEKHGTCYWSNARDYFEQIQRLYSNINQPNNLENILQNQTISKRLRREWIKQSFLQLNPRLPANAIDIRMINRARKLREIAFCYNSQFNYTDCI